MLVAFVSLVLLPVSAIIVSSIIIGVRNGRDVCVAQLQSVTTLKTSEIDIWLQHLQTELSSAMVGGKAHQSAMSLLAAGEEESAATDEARRYLQDRFNRITSHSPSFEGISLFSRAATVVAATGEQPNLPAFSVFLPNNQDSPEIRIHADTLAFLLPVRSGQGNTVGVLAGLTSAGKLNKIMQERTGLGATGETYLVDSNHNLISSSRFSGYAFRKVVVDTVGANAAIKEHASGYASYMDYRGVPVIGVYQWLPQLQAALLAERDQREVFSSIYTGIMVNLAVAGIAVFIAVIASFLYSKRIANPLIKLANIATRIAGGDLKLSVEGGWSDEIGVLAHAFNSMTVQLAEREEALRSTLGQAEEARDKIDAILKSVPDGLIVTDLEQRIVMMNHFAEKLFGVSTGEVFRQPVAAAIGENAFLDYLAATLVGKGSEEPFEIELFDASRQEVRIIRAETSLVRSREGVATGLIVLLRDITREREIDRMKSEFICTAAHELKTPICSVMGYAELLLRQDLMEGIGAEQRHEFLATIHEKGEALNRIVDELLLLSRMESGRPLPLERAPFNLRETIDRIVVQRRMESPERRFDLDAPEEIEIIGDRGKIIQVLENLLGNAVKYSPVGTPVRVTCAREGDLCRVSVEDEGIGMTAQQAALAFEKFYRADTSSTSPGGLGLGLSISRHIIEAHGGRIGVESEMGRGTIVFFTLPAGAGER